MNHRIHLTESPLYRHLCGNTRESVRPTIKFGAANNLARLIEQLNEDKQLLKYLDSKDADSILEFYNTLIVVLEHRFNRVKSGDDADSVIFAIKEQKRKDEEAFKLVEERLKKFKEDTA